MDKLTWRGGTAEDQPLLFTLFAADKSEEFAPLGLTPQQLQPLLEMQFRARQLHYAQAHPAAVEHILCLDDGTAVGRHLVERQKDSYRGVDLAILPGYRDRGIGSFALRQIQLLAAFEGVPVHLSVFRANGSALRLYERLGFARIAANEIAFEMEWQPRRWPAEGGRDVAPEVVETVLRDDDGSLPRAYILDTTVQFLRQIGLSVEYGPVSSRSFLPGIQPVSGGLRVDCETLLYPGDLLHEAGHLALMTPERRAADFPNATGTPDAAAEEMGALAWSYAAAAHIGLPPEVVFHEHGYKGQARSLIAEFRDNPRPFGVPILGWLGLTTQTMNSTPSIFPRMLRWLREEPPSAYEPKLELKLEQTA